MKRFHIKTIGSLVAGGAVYGTGTYLLRNFKVSYSGDSEVRPVSFYLKEQGIRSGIPLLAGIVAVEGTRLLLDKCFPEKKSEQSIKENWTERVTASSSKTPSGPANPQAPAQTTPSL